MFHEGQRVVFRYEGKEALGRVSSTENSDKWPIRVEIEDGTRELFLADGRLFNRSTSPSLFAVEEPSLSAVVEVSEKLEHCDAEGEYLKAAGESFAKKAREAEGEFINSLPPPQKTASVGVSPHYKAMEEVAKIKNAEQGAIDLLRADCDRLTAENEQLKQENERQRKRIHQLSTLNDGLLMAVAVLGNRLAL